MERSNVINGEATTSDMRNPWRRVVNYADYARTWERTPASRAKYRLKPHGTKHRAARARRGR